MVAWTAASEQTAYAVLLPVKPRGRRKTRLGDLPRDLLAASFALDTATACLDCPLAAPVPVVSAEVGVAASLCALGCEAIPDGVSGDLNLSLALAATEVARRWPHLIPVAMCADLPCLSAEELEAALFRRPGLPRFVADASGAGTTLYTA